MKIVNLNCKGLLPENNMTYCKILYFDDLLEFQIRILPIPDLEVFVRNSVSVTIAPLKKVLLSSKNPLR